MQDRFFRHRRTLLLIAFAVALGVRLHDLAGVGLAEDEVNKVNAVRSYRAGDFTANADHPMLMKTLILGARLAADAYNAGPAAGLGLARLPEETVVRLPNAVFGALTVFVLYLLATSFFNWRVGMISAWLWATGIDAVFINRVAKEDTLLVFFILLGTWLHRRMKQTPDAEASRKRWFYYGSAAAFGAMLASKYFPHYIGLNMLYFWWHRKAEPSAYPADAFGGKELLRYLLVLGLVFLLLNPVILSPAVIRHIAHYTGQGTVTHHGYVMMDTLYYNNVDRTPFNGTPGYFYLLFLGVKVPPLVLLAAAAGLALCLRRRREAGPFLVLFHLAFWLAPYSLFGVKFMRYTLSLMPVVYLLAACGIEAVRERLAASLPPKFSRPASALVPVVVLASALGAFTFAPPFHSLYVNGFGGGASRVGYYFPHDEFYDLQLREAIRQTAREAPPGGAVFAGETPAVFRYYLEGENRPDIRVVNLSDPSFARGPERHVYVFLQPGRRYFENAEFHRDLWRDPSRRTSDFPVRGVSAVRVFRLDWEEFLRIADQRSYFATNHRQRG
ncbi:MAG: glycosyltransferase family 39 protein [Acidobacteria bacterium]|nr:glycosyltransferase family 39 protein [Acidobacteriota bacterium]